MALESGLDPAGAWEGVKRYARSLKQRNVNTISTLANSSVTVEYVIFDTYRTLKQIRDNLAIAAAISGMNTYVQSVRGDTYDAVAAINAVVSALDDVLAWVDINAAGLSLTGDTAANAINSGSVVSNRFNPTQTTALRTLLQAVNDLID